jgi:hypothetical protein
MEAMEVSVSVKGTFSSFRYRDFRLLWSGAFVSNVGTWIHNAALLRFVGKRRVQTPG